MHVCAGKPCWKQTGSKGFLYKDCAGVAAGITKLKLGAGTGKAKIALGKGAALALPLPIPLGSVVTVQLVKNAAAGGDCWESVFTPPAGTNKANQFGDKLP